MPGPQVGGLCRDKARIAAGALRHALVAGRHNRHAFRETTVSFRRIHFVALFVLFALVLNLAGCGFRLRDEVQLPSELRELRLDMVDSGPRIRRELIAALERGGVSFAPADATEVAVLRIPTNEALTEAMTISEQARVREYAVRHRVVLEVLAANGDILMPQQEILLQRDFVFDERDALGVAGQEEALRRDLEREMVRTILRRIESLDGAAVATPKP